MQFLKVELSKNAGWTNEKAFLSFPYLHPAILLIIICDSQNKDFKQITIATSTMKARSKIAKKWLNVHAWTWSFGVMPNPRKWRPALWRSCSRASIKFNFSPIFYNHWFQNLSWVVFHFIKKVFDASGFPVITSSLHFTNSKSKWERNPIVTVWMPLA